MISRSDFHFVTHVDTPKHPQDASGRDFKGAEAGRERQYREGREFRPIEGKTVILVDDGLATGASMRAAAIAIKQLAASRCVLAVPVGAPVPVRIYEMKQMKSSVQVRRTRFTRSANSIAIFLRPPMTKYAS